MGEEGRRVADRYDLISVLGEGGMGVVWRARDTRLGRAVAVKVLSAASVGNEVARTRLIREARAAAALEHDGIIRVYDVGETDDGGAFLVMELVRGRSLRDRLDEKSLGVAGTISVIIDAARALGFAHAAGIVHRDVKPDNIMVRENGRATVVDFGVAKPVATELLTNAETLAGVTSKSLTAAGALVGTPAYLAPEQARGVGISAATDQFSLAVTAYEALSGELPWRGQGVVELVASLLRDESLPISSRAPVPSELDAVLKRALAKLPEDRFPDMEAFASALEEASRGLPAEPSVRPSVRERAAERRDTPLGADPPKSVTPRELINETKISAATASPSALTPAVPDAPRSQSVRVRLLAAVGVAAIGAAAFAASRGGTAPTSGTTAPAAASVAAAATDRVSPIACPMFEVTGIDEPWLGGSAAAFACERVQFARGGFDERTLVPAELASAPRELASPGFTASPLDGADARPRTVAAAKQRGVRWVDGRLDKQPTGYRASVVLRAPDGRELARGEGQAVEIFEAVRDALRPSLEVIEPPTGEELARMRTSLDVSSVGEALDLLDVRTAILIEDLVSLKDACAAVERRKGVAPRVAYLTKLVCARKLRTGKVSEPPPALDESTPGALITTTLARGTEGGPAAVRERAARLERERDKTTDPEGQARLAAAAAELYNSVGDERARQLARIAVQSSPKAFDWRTSSWHRLAFASEGEPLLFAMLVSWHPWEPITHSLRATSAEHRDHIASYLLRAYLLSQRGFYAINYGERLALEGNTEAARSIAELTNDDLLRVEVLMSEGKLGAALAAVRRTLDALAPTEANAALAFRLADFGARAAITLERPAEFVDTVVTRFVASEPHHVIDGVVPFLSLVSACCFAPRPTGKRCVARLQELRTGGKLPTIFNGADTVVAGAARFVADDYAGAAKAWRTQLRAPGWIQQPLVDVMAVAFDRGGAPELGDEMDATRVALVDVAKAADASWVRSAKRAQKKGDNVRARKLAQAVVDKWRFADEDIPAVREMKELLAKLPP